MKKLLAVLLTALMLLSLVSAFAEEQITLQLWSIATESDSSHQTYVDAIAAYEAEHPNIKIEHTSTENNTYKTKIKAAMSSGEELPDIFFTWSMGFLGEFVKGGRVVCLDDYYPTYAAELPEAMTQNDRYDGKLYGVPYTMSLINLYANMDLLAEAGYDHIPTTIEEMNECCDALLAKGIIPFGVSGMQDGTWCLTEYLEPLMIKSVGSEALTAMYMGEASWDDEGIVAAVAAFQDMVNKGYFDPSATALSNDEVKQNFISGKYAFYQNGSWNNADIGSQAKFNVQIGTFPVLNPEKGNVSDMIGGPNNTLAVTETSEHKEEAIEAAFWLARYFSDADYKSGANLPVWAADPNAEVSDLVKVTLDLAANANSMVLFGDNIMSADAANTYLDYVAQAYAGDITPEEFAAGMAADLG